MRLDWQPEMETGIRTIPRPIKPLFSEELGEPNALHTQVHKYLDKHPGERTPTASGPYDPVEEEPNFEVAISCIRDEQAAMPHSNWRMDRTIEGVPDAPMSQRQRDYMAAVLRHIATEVQASFPKGDPDTKLAELARMSRVDLRAAMDNLVGLVEGLVIRNGVPWTASQLGMKETQIRHMIKTKGGDLRLLKEGAESLQANREREKVNA